MHCSRNDIVLLPIPFADLMSSKVRPAIVVGHGSFPGDLFVVPLTSQLANADFALARWRQAGLNVPSGVKASFALWKIGSCVRSSDGSRTQTLQRLTPISGTGCESNSRQITARHSTDR